jgi:molecular chaperone DnaK (HSP70)
MEHRPIASALRESCMKALEMLSLKESVTVKVGMQVQWTAVKFSGLEIELERKEFESVIEPICIRVLNIIKQVPTVFHPNYILTTK